MIINVQDNFSGSGRYEGVGQCAKRIGQCFFLGDERLHARDEPAHLSNDAVQLSDGIVESLRIRLRDSLKPLLGQFQPHADGIERLQQVVMKILAEAFSFFKCPPDGLLAPPLRFLRALLFRNVDADSHHTPGPIQFNDLARQQKTPCGVIPGVEHHVEIAKGTLDT